MKNVKTLLVILDGFGDLPCKTLKGKTPLEAAKCENLNYFSRKGIVGCALPAGSIPPESDVGVLAVLGFDYKKFHLGRGVLETWGLGYKFKNGQLALRTNFACEKNERVIYRNPGKDFTTIEAKKLEKEINTKVKLSVPFFFKATVDYRGVVVFSGLNYSKEVTNTHPGYVKKNKGGISRAVGAEGKKIISAKPLDATIEAKNSARIINEFVEKTNAVLEKSSINKKRIKQGKMPANCLLLRDAETRLRKPPNYLKDWAILADMPLEKGIGKLLEMKRVPIKHAFLDKRDYAYRANKAIQALKKNNKVYVHLKTPDLPSHDGLVKEKVRVLKEIDLLFFSVLKKKIDLKTTRLLVTGDHCTPVEKKAHSADSVPYLLAGPSFAASNKDFTETNARKVRPIKSSALMSLLK
ncbi:phosphoglycerate mutase [Candidatus Micrarchaeota archaeon]|nr:phosphoglycerate mutase [Candidatus Micrarchaeota archaeon]